MYKKMRFLYMFHEYIKKMRFSFYMETDIEKKHVFLSIWT